MLRHRHLRRALSSNVCSLRNVTIYPSPINAGLQFYRKTLTETKLQWKKFYICPCARPRAQCWTLSDCHSPQTLHTATAAEAPAQVPVMQHVVKGTVIGPSS